VRLSGRSPRLGVSQPQVENKKNALQAGEHAMCRLYQGRADSRGTLTGLTVLNQLLIAHYLA
jgi:hypothetical protein